MAIDIHQHLWSESVLGELACRRRAPRVRRHDGRAATCRSSSHPGPDPWQPAPRATDDPPWWTAMTAYVDAMAAAWHAFIAFGRPSHPRLRVVFALLAGGAPLHIERLAARGGPVAGAHDRRLFYDTSSYGVQAIDAMIRIVGIDQLVHGSDRPMVAPLLGPGAVGSAAWRALTSTNPARLLGAVG